MLISKTRVQREKKTIELMIAIYCRKKHRTKKGLCQECRELLNYAAGRLDKCRFAAAKPVCNKCTVHCYKPQMREKIRRVMGFSGPRMLLAHPVAAVQHFLDGFKDISGNCSINQPK
ncbi:MAG: nitrous oxide-stimulated promoter family protein [Desulfitobacteriaceae bacterium]|nr:nitrous oxide-stimulated promoter family protein [Desulfitobacteriaceae bacterium]MDD4752239.1 nitrous oxide-stimulated promoter family protein [Desulfitobacteriaceae bacterium]